MIMIISIIFTSITIVITNINEIPKNKYYYKKYQGCKIFNTYYSRRTFLHLYIIILNTLFIIINLYIYCGFGLLAPKLPNLSDMPTRLFIFSISKPWIMPWALSIIGNIVFTALNNFCC